MSESADTVSNGTAAEPGVQASPPAAPIPTAPAVRVEPVDDSELSLVKAAHLRFVRAETGTDELGRVDGLIPIHFYPLLRFDRVRSDYPIVFPADGGEPKPLTSVIDEIIEASEKEGDQLEYFRREALRAESAIRSLADVIEEAEELPVMWNRALDELINTESDSGSDRNQVLSDLGDARDRLAGYGLVRAYGKDAARALVDHLWHASALEKVASLEGEVETLIQRLRSLLEIDESETHDAHTPDVLEESVGETFGDEFDFSALSDLMEKGPHGPTLSKDRRRRIEGVLTSLSGHLEHLKSSQTDMEPIPVSLPDDLYEQARRHRERCFDLVKSVQIGRLEAANQYDENVHPAQFEAFRPEQMAMSDLVSVPSAPLIVDGSDLEQMEPALQDLLDGLDPLTVVVTISTPVPEPDAGFEGLRTSPGLRLLAGGRPTAALFQVDLRDLKGAVDSVQKAMSFAGIAVVCLYIGDSFGESAIHPYLRAAAVCDGRVVPAFSNDPSDGPRWASSFRIAQNVDSERDWPESVVAYVGPDGKQVEHPLAFTAADVMAMEPRFSDGFRQVPSEHWHDDMVPMSEFLDLDTPGARIPYILMASETGSLGRVICSQRVVESTMRIRARWRSLQELGGINNSHADVLLQAEKQRLEEESQARIDEKEAELKAVLDEKTGTLAERIVANIAAGLLSTDLAAGAPAIIPRPAPTTAAPAQPVEAGVDEAPAQEPSEEPALEEEEEEVLSFDEAYIETPRCTTCDECTVINPRLFAYNENKQAYIADITAGTFRELVLAAEKCPVKIIHPGKPIDPNEPHLDELVARAEAFR